MRKQVEKELKKIASLEDIARIKKKLIPMPILELATQSELSFEELTSLETAISNNLDRLDEDQTEIMVTQENLDRNFAKVKIEYKGLEDNLLDFGHQYATSMTILDNKKQSISNDRQVLVKVRKRLLELLR